MSVVEQTANRADISKKERFEGFAIGAAFGATVLVVMAAWLYFLARIAVFAAAWLFF
ncbi:uncharacterized BrkB/YihY/UPF0761 family membrane protein [Bradyrhizobium sp. USDA 326]|uniref:hypothetical protein n=1 Tax=unclassified Bradyrhizobium TaxID=2631580 RepID=UPI003512BF44